MITDIANKLQQDTGINIVAGHAANPSIYSPYACVYLISTVLDPLTNLTSLRVQVSVWATDYPTAQETADKIYDSLHGFRGKLGDYNIRSLTLTDRSDVYDNPTQLYGVQLDFQIITL